MHMEAWMLHLFLILATSVYVLPYISQNSRRESWKMLVSAAAGALKQDCLCLKDFMFEKCFVNYIVCAGLKPHKQYIVPAPIAPV